MENREKILTVKNLRISFKSDSGLVQAVRGVSFDLYKGETLCIVGESGSGKSVTNKAIMGILANNAIIEDGQILYEGEDLVRVSEEEFHRIRGHKIGMIFQDPLSALNPVMKVGKQIIEATMINRNILKKHYNELISKEHIKFNNEITVITGPNGAGKSTLAKIIMGIIKPTSGSVLYNDQDITDFSITQRAKIGFSYSFQQPVKFKGLRVCDILRIANAKKDVALSKYLKSVGWCSREYMTRELSGDLSGGERVKVSIAKILVSDNNLLILDEPTNFLDIESIESLEKLLKEYNGTILFVTHDKTFIDHIATDILVIKNYKIIEYEGNYSSYLQYEKERSKKQQRKNENDKLLLDFKISQITTELAMTKDEQRKKELEEEFNELIKLKHLTK